MAGSTYQMTPAEIADAYEPSSGRSARARRPSTSSTPGLLSGDRGADAALSAPICDVGVTWWLEHIYPGRMSLDEIHQLIRVGPPRTS